MQANLKILAKGFQVFEQRIIDTTVRLSTNRTPSLSLLQDTQINEADVIIIDALDTGAMDWADSNKAALDEQVVIWVDLTTELSNRKHTVLNRPVLWVNLPITATRVLEELSQAELGEEMTDEPESAEVPLASILVTDDSQAIRDYLSQTLKRRGYAVTAAESGEDAVEMAKKQRFDCVLMDVLMPGIDGYKACREIRRIKSSGKGVMPVVMLTSKTSPFDKIRGKMAGCNAYLTKPVKMQILLDTVKKYAKV